MSTPDALDEMLANMPGARPLRLDDLTPGAQAGMLAATEAAEKNGDDFVRQSSNALAGRPAGAFDTASPNYERCNKCRGTGRFVSYGGRTVGQCFHCKGMGGFMRAQPIAKLAQQRERAHERMRETRLANVEGFKADYAAEFQWMVEAAPRFNFAGEMLDTVNKFGALTDGQLAAVRKCMLRDIERADARKADGAAREAAAPIVTDKLTEAFAAALGAGLKKPQLRFEGFTASPAKPEGKNPGAIYIKRGGQYLGKIVGGKLHASQYLAAGALAGVPEAIAAAMVDPLAAALAYGRSTGTCSCCGRFLSDPQSVAAGIGPVCASKFGF